MNVFVKQYEQKANLFVLCHCEKTPKVIERFVLAVKQVISNIIKMPFAYAVRYKNVRIAHTKVFPYNIHFYIDEANHQVVIIGIVHNKRGDAVSLDRQIP